MDGVDERVRALGALLASVRESVETGRLDEAVQAAETLTREVEGETHPRVVAALDAVIEAYSEIYDTLAARYGERPAPTDLDVVARLAWARLGLVEASGASLRVQLGLVDEVIGLAEVAGEDQPPWAVLAAMYHRGALLCDLDLVDEGLRAWRRLIDQYPAPVGSWSIELDARYALCAELKSRGRNEETIAACDALVERYAIGVIDALDANAAATVSDRVLQAMWIKVDVLAQPDQREARLVALDAVLAQCGRVDSERARNIDILALYLKFAALIAGGRSDEAVEVSERLRELFISERDRFRRSIASRRIIWMASAFLGDARATHSHLNQAERLLEAVAQAFADSEDVAFQVLRVRSMICLAALLSRLHRRSDAEGVLEELMRDGDRAIVAIDTILAETEASDEDAPSEDAALAAVLLTRAALLTQQSRDEEALAAADDVIARFAQVPLAATFVQTARELRADLLEKRDRGPGRGLRMAGRRLRRRRA